MRRQLIAIATGAVLAVALVAPPWGGAEQVKADTGYWADGWPTVCNWWGSTWFAAPSVA